MKNDTKTINIFAYQDYKMFILDLVKTFPSNGRGTFLKLANFLSSHTTHISQVFKGERDLTLEQGHNLCKFFDFDGHDKKYFLTMISYARAGSFDLKKYYQNELEVIKIEAKNLSHRLKIKKELTDQEMSRFYSSPIYSIIRLTTSLKEINTIEAIHERLNLPRHVIDDVIDFLISTGLCIKENGLVKLGHSKTHVPENSPYVINHHRNWRIKGLEKQTIKNVDNLFYTGPMVLSKKDALKVREIISELLQDVYKIIEPSDCEELHCLNIDWFKVL